AVPDRVRALESLKGLYERREQWPKLVQVVEKLAWVEPKVVGQLAAWRTAARLYADRLGARDRALECWLRALVLVPDDTEARERVRVLSATDAPVTESVAELCQQVLAKSKGHPEAQ